MNTKLLLIVYRTFQFQANKQSIAKLLLLLVLIMSGYTAKAADFTSSAVLLGNWNNNLIWTLNSGTDADGIPDADDTVTISAGNNISLTANAECASLTINGNALLLGIVTINGFTLTVGGNITIAGGANSQIVMTSGTLNVAGNFGSGASFTRGTGTVNYNGAGNQSVGTYNYANLTLSGSGTKTFTGAIAVGTNITIDSGVVANLGTFASSTPVLTLGGLPTTTYTWGNNANVRNQNTTFFAANSGYINVTNNTLSCNTSLIISANNLICTGGNATFNATATNPGASPVYQWLLNGGVVGTNSTTFSSTTLVNGDVVSCKMTTCRSRTDFVTSNSIVMGVSTVAGGGTPTSVISGGNVALTATASPTSYVATLLNENFNAATNSWLPGNSSTGGTPANAAWTLRPNGYQYLHNGSATYTFYSDDYSQFYISNSSAQGGTASTTLKSPVMNSTGYSSLLLEFYEHTLDWDASDFEIVEVSTNNSTWTVVSTNTTTQGISTNFVKRTVNLDAYINQPTLYIRFRYEANFDHWWALDNVKISGNYSIPYTYSWAASPAGTAGLPAGADTLASGNTSITANPTQNTVYTATARNTVSPCSVLATPVNVTILAPTITNFTPASTCAGTGVSVVITGTNFTAASAVQFNGVAAASFTVNSNTQITATSPVSATTGTITVTTAGGTATSAGTFTVNPLPTITIPDLDLVICSNEKAAGATFVYTNTTQAPNTYSVIWDTGLPPNEFVDVTDAALSGGTILIPIPASTASNFYSGIFTVKNANGCVSDEYSFTIQVAEAPSVSLTSSVLTTCYSASSQVLPLAYQLLAGLPNQYSITWDSTPANSFAAVTNANLPANTININVPAGTAAGSYTGTLVIRDSFYNCTESHAIQINVNAASVGGSVSPAQSVCTSATPLQSLVLSGHTGTILRWESATDAAFTSPVNIAVTSNTLPTGTIGNLAVSTYFRAVVQNANCAVVNSASVLISVYPLADAPIATGETNVTCNSMRVNWNAAANATGYYIDVATDSGFTDILPAYNNLNVNNVLFYDLTGLTGTNYYYRVRAYNTCSELNANTGTSVQTTALAAPIAMTGVRNCEGFIAQWNAVSGATSYILSVATDSNFSGPSHVINLNAADIGNLTSYDVKGLIAGTTYYFKIWSINATCGISALSSNVISIVAGSPSTITWEGSWPGGIAPTSADNVVFNAPYSSTGDMTACSCVVNSGVDVEINGGHTLTVVNAITTTGNLRFKNNATLLQTTNVQNTANIIYERETSVRKFDFTFWSSPVQDQKLIDLSPNTLSDKYQSYTGTAWTTENPQNVMKIGKGYNVRGPQSHSSTVKSDFLGGFDGIPNNGDLTSDQTILAGRFYLIGNPYPSAIDADELLADNSTILDGTVYFWTNNTGLTQNGNVYSYATNDYASYNGVGGVAGSGGETPSGYISAGQAVFAKTIAAGSVVFNNGMRVDGGSNKNGQFFKPKRAKKSNTERSRIWLNMTNDGGAFKQILIGYITGATNGYETKYDGVSTNAHAYVDFYSICDDKNLVIQGRAIPFEESDWVPLGYRSSIEGSSSFDITIANSDGVLANQGVFLEDKVSGTFHDLRASKYTFTTMNGSFKDRFILHFTNKSLGVDDFDTGEELVVTVNKKVIKIFSEKDPISSIRLFDLTGKLIYTKEKIDANEFSILNLHSSEQTLLVKVGLENHATVTKKIIFR
ncbi:T9SS sorting signal type C domain-containing protein [Flavobacterium sp. GA093]|uniref:T9SS sorting signal type C domain-containing protein n=1 Tax=Flavobacterium hydrocarbonoxydans TaxID=2683249 RepID=A0A6I4NR93_9FLAO|nr:T9SS sorting signal type C domain-containing protein [Flavobacterium hydrocarbonoxydans]MWB93617.1 T9SS sorting signal type C domain-containing protein [Flavobacterium hydrocarbonoxydans]